MKRIFLLMLVFVSLAACAQTTPSYKNVKLTQLPLGTKNDSIVLTNGSTKLLRYIPVSQIKLPTNLTFTATPTGGTVFSSTGTDALIPLSNATNAGLLSPTASTFYGSKTFDSGEILIKGQIDGSVGKLFKQNDIFAFQDSFGKYCADFSSGSLGIYKADGNYGRFYTNILTGNRDYTLPNQSGTLALTSDLSSFATVSQAQTIADLKVINNLSTSNTSIAPSQNAVNTALALKANLASPTFTGSVQVPNATLSTQAVNKSQLDAVVAKTYKTYFVNSVTGNNSTGVYEDPSNPFATIDYILALPAFKNGDILYLQNDAIFPLNGTIPNVSLEIKSNMVATLDFSNNLNTSLINSPSLNKYLKIDLPYGTVKNDRTNGTGAVFNFDSKYFLDIKCGTLYLNTSTGFFSEPAGIRFDCQNVIASSTVINEGWSEDVNFISINTFTCLQSGVSLFNASVKAKISIGLINGGGSYKFNGNYDIGNIETTGTCYVYGVGGKGYLNFRNSVITSAGGILLGNDPITELTVTGNIVSSPSIFGASQFRVDTFRFLNFSANLNAGFFTFDRSTVTFENCSIKSTNSPLKFENSDGYNWANIFIKSSVFEVTNAAPLVTGGAGGFYVLKIAGVSTNATLLSDQSGTGVTVTQFTNY